MCLFLLTVLGCRVCELLCDDACWILCVLVLLMLFNVCVCDLIVTMCEILYGTLLCVLLCCVFVCLFSHVCDCVSFVLYCVNLSGVFVCACLLCA